MAIDDECNVCGRTIALHSHGCPQAFIQQEPEQSVEEMLNRQDGVVIAPFANERSKQLLGAIQCEPITSRYQPLKDPRDLIPHTTTIKLPENPTQEQVEHFIRNSCYCSVFGETHYRTPYCKTERSPEHEAEREQRMTGFIGTTEQIQKQFDELPIQKKDNMYTVLDEAAKLTSADRNEAYGHPKQNFSDIAKAWEMVLKTHVTPEQVGLCMILVKVARQAHRSKRDNIVDIAGFARTIEMLGE